jgi:hypothetical protein
MGSGIACGIASGMAAGKAQARKAIHERLEAGRYVIQDRTGRAISPEEFLEDVLGGAYERGTGGARASVIVGIILALLLFAGLGLFFLLRSV